MKDAIQVYDGDGHRTGTTPTQRRKDAVTLTNVKQLTQDLIEQEEMVGIAKRAAIEEHLATKHLKTVMGRFAGLLTGVSLAQMLTTAFFMTEPYRLWSFSFAAIIFIISGVLYRASRRRPPVSLIDRITQGHAVVDDP